MKKENKNIKENNKLEENKEIKDNTEQEDNDNKSVIEENIDNSLANQEEEKDNRTFSEKLEDTLDDIVYNTQKAIYGDIDNFSENIPAMQRHPDNEIRHINKVQTRRNFNKWLFGKKGYKIIFAIFAVCIIIGLIVSFVK